MKKRTHEIKVRLNDQEFAHITDMAERSILSREAMIREILNGHHLIEKPTVDEWQIFVQLRNITTTLYLLETRLQLLGKKEFAAEIEPLRLDIGYLCRLVQNTYAPTLECRSDLSDLTQAFLERHKEEQP